MERDRQNFVTARTDSQRAIRIVKGNWLLSKAERRRHNGKTLWRCVRDIHRCRRGRLVLNKLGVPHRFVELIKSFHEETKILNGKAVEEINVHNGFCMAQLQFCLIYIYMCLVIERWLARVDGIGIIVQYKYDQ